MIISKDVFAQRALQLRTEKGLTTRALASNINMSNASITLYEQGKRSPTAEAVVKYAIYFNVSTDWLLGLTNNRYR